MKVKRSGKKILAIIYQFSEYIVLNVVSDQSKKTVAEVLRNNCILKFRAPKIRNSACGKSFEANLIK